MSPRAELAVVLQSTFPTHNVYASPPGKIELPAIIIAPDSPYVSRSTFCVYEWHFQVGLVVGRTSDNQDLDLLDGQIEDAWKAFRAQAPQLAVQEVRSIDAMDIGGTPYVAAVFPVTMKGNS
jgi:hypothetical protein